MVLDIRPEQILHETDLQQVERELNNCALQLAILGEVDTARELIGTLLRNDNRIKPDRLLSWAWRETGQWPQGSAEESKADEAFAELNEDYEQEWGNVPVENRTFDDSGLQACLVSRERKEFADCTTGHNAMLKGARLVKALDISIRLYGNTLSSSGEEESHTAKRAKNEDGDATDIVDEADDWVKVSALDKTSADILGQIVSRWNANQQVKYLAEAERLWPFYITGVVADAMDVGRAELSAKGRQLLEVFSQRLESGKAKTALAGKTIRELLDIANENTIRGPGREHFIEAGVEESDMESWTMFRDAATDEEINELENRLGVELPDDYKDFLRITNGFGVVDINYTSGIYNGFFPDPALHSVDKVNWNDKWYFRLPVNLLELPQEFEEYGNVQNKKSDETLDWNTALPLFDRVLEIGTEDIDNLWLVHPELLKQTRDAYNEIHANAPDEHKRVIDRAIEAFAGSREEFDRLRWCFVKWSGGGSACMTAYASFGAYLEQVTAESMETKE